MLTLADYHNLRRMIRRAGPFEDFDEAQASVILDGKLQQTIQALEKQELDKLVERELTKQKDTDGDLPRPD